MTREELRAHFVSNPPAPVQTLVDACRMLPDVEPDGSSECPFAESLYFKKEEAVLRVQEMRGARKEDIKELQKAIEEVQNSSTEPSWATEFDKVAHTPNFDHYYNQKCEMEERVRVKVGELKEQIWWQRVLIDVIDEFLEKAAQKKFPGVPRDRYGKAPGEKVVYDPRADMEKKVQEFLDGR